MRVKQIIIGVLITVMAVMPVSAEGQDIRSSTKIEGDGFDTAKEALSGYIEGLKNNDIDQMLSAFAVETYVDKFDIEKSLERVRAYIPNSAFDYIPDTSDFSRRLNIEKRRAEILNEIRYHYLILTGSKAITSELISMDNYETVNDFIKEFYVEDDTSILNNIEFNEDYLDPSKLNDAYSKDSNQTSMKKTMDMISGEDYTSVAALFYCNDDPILLCADAVKYNGRWYLSSMGGNIGALMGIAATNYGMVSIKNDENFQWIINR